MDLGYVNHYFSSLFKVLNELDILDRGQYILNMNKTGWGKEQQFKSKGAQRINSKHWSAYKIFSLNLKHVTSVHTGTARGEHLPPMIIYSECLPRNLPAATPEGWVLECSKSGLMNQQLFAHSYRNQIRQKMLTQNSTNYGQLYIPLGN